MTTSTKWILSCAVMSFVFAGTAARCQAQGYFVYRPVVAPVVLAPTPLPTPVYAAPVMVAPPVVISPQPIVVTPAPIMQSTFYAPAPVVAPAVVAPAYYRQKGNYGLFGQWNERVATAGPYGTSFQHTRVGWNGVHYRGYQW
ncbi:MAG: hypothetical protein U0903_12625 [Planctomycetales bacterium]